MYPCSRSGHNHKDSYYLCWLPPAIYIPPAYRRTPLKRGRAVAVETRCLEIRTIDTLCIQRGRMQRVPSLVGCHTSDGVCITTAERTLLQGVLSSSLASSSVIHTPRLTAYPSLEGTAAASNCLLRWTAPATSPILERGSSRRN